MSVDARESGSMFESRCSVAIEIKSPPEKLWRLLTDAKYYAAWNSTVTSIDGTISPGGTLVLKVPVAPKRTFKPKVSEFDPCRRMVWSDGAAPMFKGVRTFTLTPDAGGNTRFEMEEVFAGLMLPLVKRSLPDFRPIFESFANDLKREAERMPS